MDRTNENTIYRYSILMIIPLVYLVLKLTFGNYFYRQHAIQSSKTPSIKATYTHSIKRVTKA